MEDKCTSLTKIEANRQNAKKSTGPKNTSLTRLNALKHGLLSKEVLLKGEDKKALQELGKKLRLELAPENELELILVDRIISSVWRLRRAIRLERDRLQERFNDSKYDTYEDIERTDGEAWSLIVTVELANSNGWLNLLRYETTIERQIYRALHELIRLQSARLGGKPPVPLAVDVDISGQG